VIDDYDVPSSVDCSGEDPQVSLSWSVANADRVTISVDGPGVYAEYGPSGQTSILFPCPGPHTYLITGYGQNGQTTTRTVTVTGENVTTTTQADPNQVDDGSGGN